MELYSFFEFFAQIPIDSSSFAFSTTGASSGFSGLWGIVLVVFFMLLSFFVQWRLKSTMNKYAQQQAPMTGAETARRMLQQNGINNVDIISTPGKLTDHYNPSDRTVNLSEMVYGESSVAAMAVAAHECGHAIQHAKGYAWLQMRSTLVPMVSISSNLSSIVLMVGLILMSFGSGATVAWIGLALFATTTVFAFVTLPVEFDASRRALAWLEQSGTLSYDMHNDARTALRWAAMTYVVAALSSLAMVLYYAILIMSRSRD